MSQCLLPRHWIRALGGFEESSLWSPVRRPVEEPWATAGCWRPSPAWQSTTGPSRRSSGRSEGREREMGGDGRTWKKQPCPESCLYDRVLYKLGTLVGGAQRTSDFTSRGFASTSGFGSASPRTKEVNPRGKYVLRLYDGAKEGEPRVVVPGSGGWVFSWTPQIKSGKQTAMNRRPKQVGS